MWKVYTLCCNVGTMMGNDDVNLPIGNLRKTGLNSFTNGDMAELAKRKFLAYWLYELIDYIKDNEMVYEYTDHGDSFEIRYSHEDYLDSHNDFEFGVTIGASILVTEVNDCWDDYHRAFDEDD